MRENTVQIPSARVKGKRSRRKAMHDIRPGQQYFLDSQIAMMTFVKVVTRPYACPRMLALPTAMEYLTLNPLPNNLLS